MILPMTVACHAITGDASKPAESWFVNDVSFQITAVPQTLVTIDGDGVISQGYYPWAEGPSFNCNFELPLHGAWSGTDVHMQSSGGGCGISYVLTLDGTANGARGAATSMSGSYRVTYTGNAGWAPQTGTWTAYPSRP